MSFSITYPFTTSTNYTFDSSKIEITSGKTQLKLGGGTPAGTYQDTMDSGTGKTFNSSLVEFVGGKAQLKLISTQDTWTEDFTNDTGFTYDNTKAEFTGGQVQQKDLTPTNATCGATYTSDINLNDWSSGTVTGTATGGAGVSGGKLDLNYSDLRYVDYGGTGNANTAIQTGTVRFKVTPNYTNPASEMVFVSISKANNSADNLIFIRHSTGGALRFHLYNSIGGLITEKYLGTWTPTSGQEYEFELNWDLTTGANRLFIDGVQISTTDTSTGTRDSSIGLLRFGSKYNASTNSNFGLNDIIVFDSVQHTANYTPGYTVPENKYAESEVVLPAHVKINVASYDSFSSTEGGVPHYTIDDKYWSGAAWVASDGSYSQSNTSADVVTNITSATPENTLNMSVIFPVGTTQASTTQTNLTHTEDLYSTTNPSVTYDADIIDKSVDGITSWDSFAQTATITGSNNIKWVLSTDGGITWLYYSGGWVTSDGTYSQSNTVAEVNTNFGTLSLSTGTLMARWFLHSDDGVTAPDISQLDVGYKYNGYITTNPTIVPNETITTDDIITWATTLTETGSDAVKFTIKADGVEKYWDGGAWSTSTGYAQSNTSAEISTNIGTLTSTRIVAVPVAYLHSDDGTTTPDIDIITITYDFAVTPPTNLTECIVYGWIQDLTGDVEQSVTVTAKPIRNASTTSGVQLGNESITTTTDSEGYWELSIIQSTQWTETPKYQFTFEKSSSNIYITGVKTVPVSATVIYTNL